MSDSMKKVERPLSPHLQVYKLPLTALMSISHRITGVGLTFGTLLIAALLIAAACGEDQYNFVMGIAGTGIGRLVLFAWTLALYFHMCNGVRHMVWDTGKLLEKDNAMKANYYVLFFALCFTAATWFLAAGEAIKTAM